jgi:hypothetical protein
MSEDEAMSALGRVCGLAIGLALGLMLTWGAGGLDYLEYSATSLCMTAVAEAGGDAALQCTPSAAAADNRRALWAALGSGTR